MEYLSIIIPARNEENYLDTTLASIEKSVNGYNFKCEIIVINDSSTDKTKSKALKWESVKVIDVNFKNRSKARNYGASQANGDYLLFIDADTLTSKNTLIDSFYSIKKDKKILWYKQLPIENNYKGIIYFFLLNLISRFYPMHSPAIFCEKNTFYSLGGFNESLKSFEDHYFIKLAWKKKVGKYCNATVYTSVRRFYKYGFWGIIKQNYLAIKDPYNHNWDVINENRQ